jgi:hypothetical protein
MTKKKKKKTSPARCAEVMSEEVVGSEFDGFFWSDQHNVDSRTYK